jgi:tetratricopeptide (TPR) repeat protein
MDLFAGALYLQGPEGGQRPKAWSSAPPRLAGFDFGALFADLTNDGRPDLFAPRGYLTGAGAPVAVADTWDLLAGRSPGPGSPAGREPYERAWDELGERVRTGATFGGAARHQLFLNRGASGLVEASAGSGLDLLDDGRAAARVDWDLDGWLDLWVANRSGPRLRFMRNRGANEGGRAVAVRLEGAGRNRDAIGARVVLELSDGRRVTAALRAGEGHLAQSSKWLHLGVGAAERIASATVRWPGGEAERFSGLQPGGRFVLARSAGVARALAAPAPVALAATTPGPQPHLASKRVLLPLRVPLPSLLIETPGGEAMALSGAHSAPLLVVAWAPDSPESLALLERMVGSSATVNSTGIGVVALDAGDAPAAAAAALNELEWPYRGGRPAARGLELLDLVRREQLQLRGPLQLPTSFLLDAAGRVVAFYEGVFQLEPMLADAGRLSSSPEALREVAVAPAGRWQAPAPHPDLERQSRSLARAGLTEAAHQLRVLQYDGGELTRESMDNEVGLVRMRQRNYADAAEHFLKAARVDPSWFPPRRNLGAALLRLGRLEEATASLELALCLRPAEPGTVYDLALAYAQLGEEEVARDLSGLLQWLEPSLGAELAGSLRGREGKR